MQYKAEDRPVGVAEISKILKVAPDTVSSWQLRGRTPLPDCLINNGKTRLWKLGTILAWANSTNRNKLDLDAETAAAVLEETTITAGRLEDLINNQSKTEDQWGSIGQWDNE
tara:strand:+ start:1775 stop:2110 length:336 start_codon:yes stop_codon:yes gene_type:complete